MAETEEDPWAQLRAASGENAAGAGPLAYSDEGARRVPAWRWFQLWLRDGIGGWLRRQLPDASTTLDSSYYLGITRRKGMVRDGMKAALGGAPARRATRIPVVVFGRRIGMPGLVTVATVGVLALACARSTLGF